MVFVKVIREPTLGSKEALMCSIEGEDCTMSGEVGAEFCQRKGVGI